MTVEGQWNDFLAGELEKHASSASNVMAEIAEIARQHASNQDVEEELTAVARVLYAAPYLYLVTMSPDELNGFWRQYGDRPGVRDARSLWSDELLTLRALAIRVSTRENLDYVNRWTQVNTRLDYVFNNQHLRSDIEVMSGVETVLKMRDDPGSVIRLAVLLLDRVASELDLVGDKVELSEMDRTSLQEAREQLQARFREPRMLESIERVLATATKAPQTS